MDNYKFPDEVDNDEVKTKGKPVDEEEGFEVEVEDDTPPQDRGRTPSEPEFVEKLDKDELDEYSDAAKQKIAGFRKIYHDERREKERAVREQQEAVTLAQKLLETTMIRLLGTNLLHPGLEFRLFVQPLPPVLRRDRQRSPHQDVVGQQMNKLLQAIGPDMQAQGRCRLGGRYIEARNIDDLATVDRRRKVVARRAVGFIVVVNCVMLTAQPAILGRRWVQVDRTLARIFINALWEDEIATVGNDPVAFPIIQVIRVRITRVPTKHLKVGEHGLGEFHPMIAPVHGAHRQQDFVLARLDCLHLHCSIST